MGVNQCMSKHIMHIAVLFASEQSSWQLVSCHTGCTICSASIAGAHHRDSGISIHFEHVSGCRPTLCPLGRSKSLPLPALASQGPSTRRSGQTLQHFNAYERDQATLTGSQNLHEPCKTGRPHLNYPLNQSTRRSFRHLSDSLRQGIFQHGTRSLRMPRISVIYRKYQK